LSENNNFNISGELKKTKSNDSSFLKANSLLKVRNTVITLLDINTLVLEKPTYW